MIVVGAILLILGVVLGVQILYALGGIVLVLGIIFWILGSPGVGRPVGGRARWY